jgi:hypothetical protein
MLVIIGSFIQIFASVTKLKTKIQFNLLTLVMDMFTKP